MDFTGYLVFVFCILVSNLRHFGCVKLGSETPLSRIAFGSCSNQSAHQPIWDSIVDFDPQLFIWMGDNIYADAKKPIKIFGRERTGGPWKNTERFSPVSAKEMEFKYKLAKTNPGYSKLRRTAQVIGTWDDHDYGLNDAGKEYVGKNISQKLMLDFLDEPLDSPRRKQAGVYTSYSFGPIGKQVKVILLDTRFHRDPLFSNGDLLGESQWRWLEKELKNNTSQIVIIGSSVQVLSNFSAVVQPLFYVESWAHFPKERLRLFNLIDDSNCSGVIFISGDVHFGEISRYDCGAGYPLYDVTSSGLTQAVENAISPPLAALARLAASITPTTMRVFGDNCRYTSCVYGKPNFGTIEIDWDAHPITIKLQVRDVHGKPVTEDKIFLPELVARFSNLAVTKDDNRQHCSLEIDLPWLTRHKIALFFCFTLSAFLFFILISGILIVMAIHRLIKRKYKTE